MAIAGSWIPSGNDQVRLTNQLRDAVRSTADAYSKMTLLSNTMAQMNASGTDYTTIETYFSIPTGLGHSVNDIVGTAATALANTNIQGLLQRLL